MSLELHVEEKATFPREIVLEAQGKSSLEESHPQG